MEKQSSFTQPTNNKYHLCMLTCCDYFYDSLSATISLLDVITDIMILIYYKQTNKNVFFMLSLIILLFVQLSYAVLFILRFASHLKIRYKLLTFLLILPICPLMSYIFYWASLPNNRLSKLLKFIGLKVSEYEPPSEKQAEKLGITKLQEYFAEKLVNHTGFVLGALFESFPQSLLQCIAMIIYYNQSTDYYNVLTFISILISLISISSKALMFSGSLHMSTFFFNWLCAVCDFFGLYLIFVWVFFVPDIVDPNSNGHGDDYSLSLFAKIWIWKFMICTVSPIVVGTIILCIFIAIDVYDDLTLDMYKESLCEYICKFFIIFGILLLSAVVWSIAVVLIIIFGEVLCCTWISFGFYYYNESRFSHSRTFIKIFHWLYQSTDSNDLLTRLIAVNYRLSHGKMMNDKPLHLFLTNVIKNDLRFCTDKDEEETTKNHKISDKDPDIFDPLPIGNVDTTNMLFESADDYEVQQKQLRDYYEEYEGTNHKFRDFGTSLLDNDEYAETECVTNIKSLTAIKFKDFRIRCKNKHKTHLMSVIFKQMISPIQEDKERLNELNAQQNYVYGINQILEIRIAKFILYIQLFAEYVLWFLFVPLYAISRLFNLLIPIIGMILIPKFADITFFQWTLTALFIVIFICLLILFPSVWKFQFLAWHVAPGYSIISPKIHSDENEKDRPSTPYLHDGNEDDDVKEEEEHTTTLEEILSDRSSAMSSNVEEDDDEEEFEQNNDDQKENEIESGRARTNNNGKRAGPRRQRRIRRKHKRQQKKQKKNKLKKIREKIAKYEKLDFYEWVKEFYHKCCSIPMIRNRINEKFGADIGRIILSYLPTIIDEDDGVAMKEVMVDLMGNDLSDLSRTFSDSYNDPLKCCYEDMNADSVDTENIMDHYSTHNQSNRTATTATTASHSNSTEDLLMFDNSSLLYYDNIFNDDACKKSGDLLGI